MLTTCGEKKRKSETVDLSTLKPLHGQNMAFGAQNKRFRDISQQVASREDRAGFFLFQNKQKTEVSRVHEKPRKWPLWAFFRENVSRHEWWLKYVFTCYFHLVDHFWWRKAKIGDGRFFASLGPVHRRNMVFGSPKQAISWHFSTSRVSQVGAAFCFKTKQKTRGVRVCMKTRKWPLWAFFRENVSRHEWWLKYVFTCYFPSCWPLFGEEKRKSVMVDFSTLGPVHRRNMVFGAQNKLIFVTFLNKSRLAVRAVFCFKTSKKPRCRLCAWKTRKWPLMSIFSRKRF